MSCVELLSCLSKGTLFCRSLDLRGYPETCFSRPWRSATRVPSTHTNIKQTRKHTHNTHTQNTQTHKRIRCSSSFSFLFRLCLEISVHISCPQDSYVFPSMQVCVLL